MSSSAIRAGQAYIEIATRQGLLDKGLASIKASLERMRGVALSVSAGIGKGFGAVQGGLNGFAGGVLNIKNALVGSLAVTGLTAWVKGFADAGAAADDLASRTGMSIESITGLGYAAKQSGANMESVEQSVRKMQQGISGAVMGNQQLRDMFGKVGVSVSQLRQMKPEQQFATIADAIARIHDPARQAAVAMELLGEDGAKLLPMLKGGSKGMMDMIDEAKSLGQVMSGEDARAAAELSDVFGKLMAVFSGIQTQVGAALAPMLITLGEYVIGVATSVVDWIDTNRDLIATLGQWFGYIAAAGGALVGLAGAAAVVSGGMAAMGALASGVATVFGAIGASIAFLISPIGLVVGGITAAVGAFLYFSGTGSAIIDFMVGKFDELAAIVGPVLQGISSALTSGQFAAAGKLAMLGIEMAFRVGTGKLYGVWTDLVVGIQNLWTDVPANFASSMIGIGATIASTFAGIPTSLMNAFSVAMAWLEGAWDSAVGYIAKKLLYLYSLFDKSVNYEEAAKQMDKESKARADARQKELDKTTGARDAALMKANSERAKNAAGMQNSIMQDANRTKQERTAAGEQRKSQFEEQTAAVGAEINKELSAVDTEAKRVEEERKKAKEARAPKPVQMPQIGQVLQASKATVGTFSGFAAGLLGSGTSQLDRMLDASKIGNDYLRQIASNTQDSGDGMVYGS